MKKKFRIYQIVIDDNFCKELDHGLKVNMKTSRVKAYFDTWGRGSSRWMPEFFREYTKVGTIECSDLENAFAALNDMGNGTEIITRYKPIDSLSVGDLLEDETGNLHMVESSSFSIVSRIVK